MRNEDATEIRDQPDLSSVPGADAARAFLEEIDPWVLDTQVALTAIPAPAFGEGPRGARMAELMEEVGLATVRMDAEGNVLADLPAGGANASTSPLVVSAHLDTVFPAETDVRPTVSPEVIRGPGIADDGRGLAALLALARVLREQKVPLPFPLLFAATVGEEGIGDLRGVRHLYREGGPGRGSKGFISLDGVGLDRIINQGIGSTRLRITLRGPGGHSWTDWGLPNPIHALGRIVSALEDLSLPRSPRTTATVARWAGGRSINAIPQDAWVEVDLRSEGPDALKGLEEGLLRLCRNVLDSDGSRGREREATLAMEITELGRRPAGSTPQEEPLVQAATRATRLVGVDPTLSSSSTDANAPMALGVPAITMGAGGRAGGIHTLDEWYSNWKGPEGILRALLTLLLLDRDGDDAPGR